MVQDPVVVFEILSPGTSYKDRIEKNREYRATPSIRRYVILEQSRPAATVYARADSDWVADFLIPTRTWGCRKSASVLVLRSESLIKSRHSVWRASSEDHDCDTASVSASITQTQMHADKKGFTRIDTGRRKFQLTR